MRIVFALLLLSLRGFSQDNDPFGDQKGPSLLVLPTDDTVDQMVSRLEAFEKQAHYLEAAELYQELMDKFPHRVVRPKEKATSARGVKVWCEQQLLGKPERLKAYREAFDGKVTRLLQDADYGTREQLAGRFALTTPGSELLVHLGGEELEAGRFDEAVFFLSKALALFPTADQTRTVVLPQLVLALSHMNDRHGLESIRAFVRQSKLEGTEIVIGLQKKTLGELIRIPDVRDQYASFVDYYRSSSSEFKPDVQSSWRFNLPKIEQNLTEDWEYFDNQRRTNRDIWNAALYPAIRGGRVMLNLGGNAVGLDLRSGKRIAQVDAALESSNSARGNFAIRSGNQSKPFFFSNATIDEDAVAYFPLVRYRLRGTVNDAFGIRRNLEAHDLVSKAGVFSIRDKQVNMRVAPEPRNGALYALIEFRKDVNNHPETLLVRIGRHTGKPSWSTFLGMNPGKRVSYYGSLGDELPPMTVTVHADTVYCCTNNGVLAAVETMTGAIKWLVPYTPTTEVRGLPPIAPPIVYGGMVVMAPFDSGHVWGIDATTGEVKWKSANRSREEPLVEGIADGRLVLSWSTSVSAMDPITGKLLWEKLGSVSRVGKGALTEKAFYIPTETGIERFTLRDGLEQIVYHWEDATRDRGSLILLSDGFLTVSESFVSSFRVKTVEKKDY